MTHILQKKTPVLHQTNKHIYQPLSVALTKRTNYPLTPTQYTNRLNQMDNILIKTLGHL